jgi:hypothetical protein
MLIPSEGIILTDENENQFLRQRRVYWLTKFSKPDLIRLLNNACH